MATLDIDEVPEIGQMELLASQVFTNSLIMEKLGKMLSFKDLQAFRLVSSTCYAGSYPTWQKKAVLCVGPFKGWGRVSVQEFMGRIHNRNIGVEAFRNFKIEYGTLPPAIVEAYQTGSIAEFRFWHVCGSSIKSLHLHHCRFDQDTLVNVLCNLTPNLESLEIRGVERVYGNWRKEAGQWKVQPNLKVLRVAGRLPFPNWRFLRFFPNLKEITLDNYSDDDLLQDLSTLRMQEHGKILNLTSIDMIHSEQSLDGFQAADLQLTRMTLRLGPDIQPQHLQDILRSQCGSLQFLQLFRFPLKHLSPLSSTPFQVDFSSLKELHLWGTVVSSFDFLQGMPSLKKLVVDIHCYEKRSEIYHFCAASKTPSDIDPYSGDMVQNSDILLKADTFKHSHLEHFQMDYPFTTESIQILGRWMPQLKFLGGIFNDANLPLVYNQWPKLTGLKLLYGSVVSDEGIIGGTLFTTAGEGGGLAKLKDLRTFEMACLCETSLISDKSANEAFLKMPLLKKLRLCISSKITQTTELLLKKAIPDVHLGRTHIYLDCCKRT